MSTVSIRVSEPDLTLFKNYAKLHDKSLSEIIRETLVSRIEDEFDVEVFAEYEKSKKQGNIELFSHEEAWKEIES